MDFDLGYRPRLSDEDEGKVPISGFLSSSREASSIVRVWQTSTPAKITAFSDPVTRVRPRLIGQRALSTLEVR
jgi:hypothetical protein